MESYTRVYEHPFDTSFNIEHKTYAENGLPHSSCLNRIECSMLSALKSKSWAESYISSDSLFQPLNEVTISAETTFEQLDVGPENFGLLKKHAAPYSFQV